MNATNQPPEQSGTGNILQVAERAFERYNQGSSTGDWTPLIEMMTDDVVVRLPLLEPRRGAKVGKGEAAATFRYVADVLKARVTLKPAAPPVVNTNTVAFEYISTGLLNGQPVSVPLVVFFDVRGGRIAGVREYIGERGV